MAGSFVTAGVRLAVKINNAYTNINGFENIDFAGGKKPTIDDTGLEDTSAKFKMGIPDFGQATGSLKWDPTDSIHTFLKTSFDNASSPVESWQVFLTDTGNHKAAFDGFLEQWGPVSLQKSSLGKLAIAIKITGAVNITT